MAYILLELFHVNKTLNLEVTVLPETLRRFLHSRQADFTEIPHLRTTTLIEAAAACDIPQRQLARTLTLVDGKGLLAVILPQDHILDFGALETALGRTMELVPTAKMYKVFHDCEPNSCPPLTTAYGLDCLVDASLLEQSEIFFEPGDHRSLIAMTPAEFIRVLDNRTIAWVSQPVTKLPYGPDLSELNELAQRFTPAHVKRSVEEFHELPSLPNTALQILEISRDPKADVKKLAAIIEQDPPLAARVMQYANSAMYGFPGKIKDLKSAIARVLGFDFVLNLALGISIGKTLLIPNDGPLGLQAYWRYAVQCATLVERLSQAMPADMRPQRGTAYLAGLLHNIGLLLLGLSFQSEFYIMNRYLESHPDVKLTDLESHVLGVGHDQIGAWLLHAWGLPDELVIAAREHHNPNYWDKHAVYAQLVLIANRALASQGQVPAEEQQIPAYSMELLGLDPQTVLNHTEALLSGIDELDALADLVA